MEWQRLYSDLVVHERSAGLSNAAVGLWARCLCWVGLRGTEGRLPRMVAEGFSAGQPELVEEVLGSGMWETDGNGSLVFHDYAGRQADAVAHLNRKRQKSTARREAGREGGLRSAERRRERDGTAQPLQASKQTRSNAEANPKQPRSKPEAEIRGDKRRKEVKPPLAPPSGRKAAAPPADLVPVVEAWNANRGGLPACRKVPSGVDEQRVLRRALDDVDGELDLLGRAFAAAARDEHYRASRYGIVNVCRHVGGRWRGVAEATAPSDPAVEAILRERGYG